MAMNKHSSESTSLSEINVTPLVDVMLVLLIIFMVTAPMLKQGVDVDLPEVNAQAVAANQDDFVVSINEKGEIFLGNEMKVPFTLTTVEEKLRTIFTNKEKKELYLHADKNTNYGYIVEVMAACQRAGVERIGMITAPEKGK